jgi:hypothetical protein
VTVLPRTPNSTCRVFLAPCRGAGVLQLVPREQREPGSIFQDALHPDGRGGYSKWAK